jgi:hypothetical protein
MNDVYERFKVSFFCVCLFSINEVFLECLRILKPNGGQLLIYTWAMEQKQRQVND